jgi:hypothetical protein
MIAIPRYYRSTAAAALTLTSLLLSLLLFPGSGAASSVLGQLLTPGVKESGSNNGTMSIHTTNAIQTSNLNVTREEGAVRKAVLSNIDSAIFIAKGSVKSLTPVNVTARIINQLANNRIDTTQGVDMTKRLLATELANAIKTTLPSGNGNITSKNIQQSTKMVADNQATCSGIGSPKGVVCAFIVTIHR